MDPMPRLELTFSCDIAEETLDEIRALQNEGEFGVSDALTLLHDAQPNVRLIHVNDDN